MKAIADKKLLALHEGTSSCSSGCANVRGKLMTTHIMCNMYLSLGMQTHSMKRKRIVVVDKKPADKKSKWPGNHSLAPNVASTEGVADVVVDG